MVEAKEKERRRLRDSIQDALNEAVPLVEYWLAKLDKKGFQDRMYHRASNLQIAYNTVVAAYDSALRLQPQSQRLRVSSRYLLQSAL